MFSPKDLCNYALDILDSDNVPLGMDCLIDCCDELPPDFNMAEFLTLMEDQVNAGVLSVRYVGDIPVWDLV